MPERLRSASQRVVGAKQTLRAAEAGRAQVVFVARDAEQRVIVPVVQHAQRHGIEVVFVDTMIDLGRMCGIEVGAAAAAIVPRDD
jgi:large subunit ribosomal protein L7A